MFRSTAGTESSGHRDAGIRNGPRYNPRSVSVVRDLFQRSSSVADGCAAARNHFEDAAIVRRDRWNSWNKIVESALPRRNPVLDFVVSAGGACIAVIRAVPTQIPAVDHEIATPAIRIRRRIPGAAIRETRDAAGACKRDAFRVCIDVRRTQIKLSGKGPAEVSCRRRSCNQRQRGSTHH